MKKIYKFINKFFFRAFLKIFYRSLPLTTSGTYLFRLAFFQKFMGVNFSVPWPVHFSSEVLGWKNMSVGKNTFPGFSPGCYIQAKNKIIFGSNVLIGPNVCIIGANHDSKNHENHIEAPPIEIGDNVWIGANSVILPSVKIGNNAVIGAGSIVTDDIPEWATAVGNPCKVIKIRSK